MTVIGGALLFWAAYKVGVYVEHKMQARLKALEAQADAAPDSEPKG
jgi:hypothetical protein